MLEHAKGTFAMGQNKVRDDRRGLYGNSAKSQTMGEKNLSPIITP